MIEAMFLYSIRSAFVLTLLYVPYMLILRKESFFRLNRAVLLLILVFSLWWTFPSLLLTNNPWCRPPGSRWWRQAYP